MRMSIRRWALVLLAIVMIPIGTGQAASARTSSRVPRTAGRLDAKTRAQLAKTLDKVLPEVDTPGVIVGVKVRKDKPWIAVRGVTDTTTNEKVTPDEHTRIGSQRHRRR